MADEGSRAGTAYIPIRPDFTGFHQAIAKQLQGTAPQFAQAGTDAGKAFTAGFRRSLGDPFGSLKAPDQTPQGTKAGGQFAAGFRKALDGALRALPKVQLDADASPAQRRIQEIRAELEELSSQRIGVDVSDDEALAKLQALQAELAQIGARSPSVSVRVDTAEASAQLAAFTGEAAGANLALDGLADGMSAATGGGEALAGAVVALSPLLVAAAASAVGLGGALAAAFSAGIAGAGAFSLVAIPAVLGIKNALTAQKTAQQEASAASAEDAARAPEHALALQEVQQAELSLANAQKNAAAAQKALSAARVKAKQDAVDLANSVKDAALQERSDELGVVQARQQLVEADQAAAQAESALRAARSQLATDQAAARKILADPGSTAAQKAAAQQQVKADEQAVKAARQAAAEQELARKQAQLAVAQAIQQLKEQQIATRRLEQQQKEAAKAGVNGDKNVVAARKALQQADNQVKQAELSLARARQEASRDAVGGSAAELAAQTKAQQALSKLSGPQKAVLRSWRALSGAYKQWAKPLQKPVLGVLNNGLKLAARLLPDLTPFVTGAAGAFSKLESKAGKALTGKFWTSFAKTMAKLSPKAISGFGTALIYIATGFAGIAEAFAPLAKPLLKWMDKATGSFAKWGTNLGKSSGFGKFLTYVKQNGPELVTVFGNLATIAFHLAEALAPVGTVMLKVLVPVTRFLAKLSPSHLLAMATGVGGLLGALAGGAIGKQITKFWGHVPSIVSASYGKVKRITSAGYNELYKINLAAHNALKHATSAALSSVEHIWQTGWNTVRSTASDIFSGIRGDVGRFFSWGERAFNTGVRALGSAWGKLDGALKVPVNWAITHVFNQGLIGAFDWISGKVGGPHIPKIPTLAKGGRVTMGTTATADDVLARISRGETVVSAAHSRVLAPLFGAVGVPGYAKGGQPAGRGGQGPSGIWHDITSGFGKAVDIAKILAAIATGNRRVLTSDITKLIPRSGARADLGQLLTAMPRTLVGDVVKYLTGQFGAGGPIGAGSGRMVAEYADRYATGLNHPYVLGGFSPGGWDCSGFAAWVYEHFGYFPGGQRSRYGTSESQFASPLLKPSGPQPGALVFFDDGIFANPGHVGVMLSQDTYVGADSPSVGTIASSAAGAVGWRIPRGGFRPAKHDDGGWMGPGLNAIYNGTRKPEAVLTSAQWQMISQAVQGGDGAANVTSYSFEMPPGTVESRVRAAISAAQVHQRRMLRPGRPH